MGSLKVLVGLIFYGIPVAEDVPAALTNTIVMIVKTIRVLPCLIVSCDNFLAASASKIFASFCTIPKIEFIYPS